MSDSSSSQDGGGVPLDDVKMEDMSDLTESLPKVFTHKKQNVDVHDERGEDANTNTMSDVFEPQPPETTSPHSPEGTSHPTNHDSDAEATTDSDSDYLEPELFQDFFAGKHVELKNFQEPSLYKTHPRRRDDIMAAYLAYTTFTVPVWVNFDAAEEVFFAGKRAESCGKLRLPETTHRSLARMHPDELRFQHVRFEIGTPFRTLAYIDFDIVEGDHQPAEMQVDGRMLVQREILREYLHHRVKALANYGVKKGLNALSLQDLELFASCFRRKFNPSADLLWEQPAYGGGEWVDVDEPEDEPVVVVPGFNNLRSSRYFQN